jgi:chemotaxis protein CheD
MNRTKTVHIPIGEFRVSVDPADILFTCVGSCVAVALYDSRVKIAGLLHIVLPGHREHERGDDRNAFYADTGVPLLIREMEQHGADRDRITAIIAGGACLVAGGNPDVGVGNSEKCLTLLTDAGIPLIRQETGGIEGRAVEIAVASGAIRIRPNSRQMKAPRNGASGSSDKPLPLPLLNTLAASLEQMRPDSHVAGRLFEALHQRELDWQEIATLVCQDFVLAMHLLQKCNSDYYGNPQSVGSFAAALSCLGPDKLRRVCVVAAAEKNSTTRLAEFGIDQKTLSRHTLASAVAAQYLALEICPELEQEAFFAALLHPVGSIAACLVAAAGKSSPDERCDDLCSFSVEPDSKSARYHRQLAGALLTKWQFPQVLAEAVSTVRSPLISSDRVTLAAVVEAACNISAMLGISGTRVQRSADFSLSALEQIKVVNNSERLFPDIILKLRGAGLLR